MREKQETQVPALGQKDPLEESMATHSSILAWKILGTEEPGRLQSMGLHQLRQEPQGTSDFRVRSQGPCRLGTGESGLVLG